MMKMENLSKKNWLKCNVIFYAIVIFYMCYGHFEGHITMFYMIVINFQWAGYHLLQTQDEYKARAELWKTDLHGENVL